MSRASVSKWLQQDGWVIGNVAKGSAEHRVAASGARRWAEIAVKDKPIEFRARKELRHGIDLPYWQECLRVEYETCVPGYLFIIQNRPLDKASPSPVLLVQALAFLRNMPVQEVPAGAQAWAPEGLIIWRKNDFAVLGDPGSPATRVNLRIWLAKGSEDQRQQTLTFNNPAKRRVDLTLFDI